MLAAEITREKIFNRLHDELPYAITVETTSWKELKDGSVRIEQTIYVERDSQKKIVLGKGGQTIKQISSGIARRAEDAAGAGRASVPVREGARELGRRPRAIRGPGLDISTRAVAQLRGPMHLRQPEHSHEVMSMRARSMASSAALAISILFSLTECRRRGPHVQRQPDRRGPRRDRVGGSQGSDGASG